jgi:dihydrolipoamide dehydrogenase
VAPASHAGHPLHVLRDTIQPFPTFSEIFADALNALHVELQKPAVVG